MSLRLEWDGLDRTQWEALFAAAGRTPLVQSWAYGEIKAAEGWMVRRGAVLAAGRVVALVQALERRPGGLLRLVRINRGPVMLEPGAERQREVLALLARLGCWWRGSVLLMAPELGAGDAPALLAGLSLRRRPAPEWQSAWLDLSLDADTLRRSLKGKWRNMLVGAEKAGLTVTARSDGPALDWILERYAELMKEKSFTGMPVDSVRRLAAAANAGDMVVLRAMAGDESVGGVLLVRHGVSATYLVGWNGEDGRRLKANNLLLWSALGELAARGCRWFDLGGIDDQLTPGIASFKRGMGGEHYRLAGEFWRI
ncbi:hypothetical protein WV31_12855 [Magnetospirillum sp. ME-1]|uniref:lipid II:glycine glycyltransferase FemX n=1 Tax=Magnetospirillum sp. ME-1 TaxID=1639348 RepID=UPI000A17F600|nr:GNAT family N-acetyltransferase [Magnetospirillum sp. ME-1]ARJ66495.1 hypothetical protein WV31_12855 [Magnetospirillum sp. ME-1]